MCLKWSVENRLNSEHLDQRDYLSVGMFNRSVFYHFKTLRLKNEEMQNIFLLSTLFINVF